MRNHDQNQKQSSAVTQAAGKLLSGLGLGAVLASSLMASAQAGVEYALRADAVEPDVYVLYVRSDEDLSVPHSIVGSAQATIVLPDGAIPQPVAGGADYKVTDNPLVPGQWEGQDMNQDVGSPDIVESNADILQVNLSPDGPRINMYAGEEVEMFRFRITGDCEGSLRLLDNSEPFGSEKPNSRNLASANAYITFADEQYVGNYDLGMANCP